MVKLIKHNPVGGVEKLHQSVLQKASREPNSGNLEQEAKRFIRKKKAEDKKKTLQEKLYGIEI